MAEPKSKTNAPFVVFNGGEIGRETLNRVTLENYGATGEIVENMWLDANGPMGLRPGWEFLADLGLSKVLIHPFIRSADEKFVLCFGDEELRVASDGDIIARPLVNSVITNGDFSTLAGWTDLSTAGSSAAVTSGRLAMNSNGLSLAGVRQSVSTSNLNVLHALEIHVHHGPVNFKCGSAAGGDQYIAELSLKTGHHSLAFTPTSANYFVEFTSSMNYQVEVESIQVAGPGDLLLDTPWTQDDLQELRFEQSLNTMYVFRGTTRQRRIERWDNNSWSLVETDERDGPFREINTDDSLTVTPTVRTGNGNLVASRNLFRPGHVGALWRITQSGQFQTRTINAADQWSDPIQVQGVGASRAVSFSVSAGLSATVRIQQSIGNTTSWADAATSTTTSGGVSIVTAGGAASQAYNDGLDNNNVYYRVGVKSGEYTSGSAIVSIYYPFASTEGVVRITNYQNPQSVSMEVLATLSTATASPDWEEGSWSNYRGWPIAGATFDGRLFTLKDDRFWGSYSDAYESYKQDEGDASSVQRSIAVGKANKGQWIIPLARLIVGTEGAEVVIRSNSLDEPITTTNLTVREMSTYGVGNVQPIKVDTRAIYIDVSQMHFMEIVYNVQMQDYVARPLTTLHRRIGKGGITQIGVMRRPETRLTGVRGDGQLLTKLFDPDENIMGWSRFRTPGASGRIESTAILPKKGTNQDELYAIISRVVAGQRRRYFERLGPVEYDAKEDARCLDSYRVYEGENLTVLSGLSHLEGEIVIAYCDGYYGGQYVVNAGKITLSKPASVVVVGLYYAGRYKSSKLAFGAQKGTAVAQRGRASKISLIVRDAIAGGIQYGPDFENMDRLKDRAADDPLDTGPALVSDTYDGLTMPGRLNKDPRVCIQMNAPFPGWIDGFVIGEEMNERVT